MGSRESDFTTLYRAHLGFVWRTLRRFGVTDAWLEDATHEVFLVLYRRMDDLDPDKARAWLYATARRVAANLRRSDERSKRRAEMAAKPVPFPSADTLLQRSEAVLLIEAFVDSLPAPQAEVFLLGHIEGLKLREIAELLACPLGTVNSRLRSARASFREYLRRIHEDEVVNG